MQQKPLCAFVLVLLGPLAGCGSESAAPADPRPSAAERDQALRESAFGELAETLERARGVEQLQQNRSGELDAALDKAEGR